MPKLYPSWKQCQASIERRKVKCRYRKVTDIAKIMSYGIMSTPALVIDEKVVSYGKVNSIEDIKNNILEEHR